MNIRKLKFTYILTVCILSVFAQKNISGSYLNTADMEIKIENNKFYFIINQNHHLMYDNDTLAECSIKWVGDQFIELNSQPPYALVQKGLKMMQTLDSTVKDSLKISFSIPYQSSDLNISVFVNALKTFNLKYSKDNKELMLPSDTKTIRFSISPEIYIPSHVGNGSYYGVLRYTSPEYVVDKNINSIDIDIPAINGSFFERYYLKGEYAKVLKDSIIWKGEVFVKKK